jgi:DNA-binding NtrC family response regulator
MHWWEASVNESAKERVMSMKVLIVDADWYFLRQARAYLEARGHHTIHEPDPAKALGRMFHWKPDVVIVDAELASAREGDLLAQLESFHPRPAVLLTSALDQFDKAWRAWQKGGDEVLFKPVMHASELHVAIVTAMENASLPRRERTLDQPTALSA